MFLGEFAHTLDSEGRVALPARLRDAFGEELKRGIVLACGAEPCIVGHTHERFEAILSGLAADPSITKSVRRDFKRALGRRAAVVVPDKQGRILIPEPLRRHAHISKEVTILGTCDSIEIWDAATHRGREGNIQAAFERVAPRLFD